MLCFAARYLKSALLTLAVGIALTSGSLACAGVSNRDILRPGDVLLGLNWEDFSDSSKLPYWYGGIRHAAVWEGTNEYVVEGGVAWGWHDSWPRGRVENTTLDEFASRYDLILVCRSRLADGSEMTWVADILRQYWEGTGFRCSCVEFIEYTHYYARWLTSRSRQFQRYATPRGIYDSPDFQYIGFMYSN